MLWIGLTGGIATGKSTVSHLLRGRGFPVIDADSLAREAVEIGTPGHEEIVRHFGSEALLSSGGLNRNYLGDVVFRDQSKRHLLESILHPQIRKLAQMKKTDLEEQGFETAFYDVPLLFEKDMSSLFDHITVVACRADVQKARLMARNGFTPEEADRRMASQLAMATKIKGASTVIYNDGTLVDLESAVDAYLKDLPRPN